ncbi:MULTISPECIES: hypothetical protein [unclassified Mesorhizobium]|uniref:hypothetical protein n=1 Tax=unclassified Mesorhizobium TaxID=325217 RepID=UPI001093D37E|nr:MULTISPECIES: hypothetical protein [unclassified Mesorhizobium]TGT91236.1 hypothetical protein EN804_07930 [Mesorhizobium sp. M8A.F.Ca.ET.161.01.1.1]TGV43484.1 hypothetical protein EN785_05620 [Mesorhizobium sp. M8A.F.Ca.ET.142.01.1.1]
MLKALKDWRGWILFAIPVVVFAWLVTSSQSFHSCIKYADYYYAKYALAEGFSYLPFTVRQYVNCSGRFLTGNSDAVIAIFTIVLAFSTIGLWASTNKLWEAGDDQMRLIEGNAKKELRAYLTVVPDGINQLIGEPDAMGHVVLKNVGRLPARNVTLLVKMELSHGPEVDSFFRRQIFDIPKVAINSDRVIQPGGEMRQGNERPTLPISDLCVPDYNVYVYGIVKYDNGYGEQCFTKFCHRYATASRDRSVKPDSRPNKSRAFISADKARYHNYGNSAELPE